MNIFELEKRIDEILWQEKSEETNEWKKSLLLMELTGITQTVEALKPFIEIDGRSLNELIKYEECYQRILKNWG